MSVQRVGDTDALPGVSRYDLLLLALPVPLLLGVGWGVLSSAPVAFAVGVAGLPSLAMLAYGLFVDAPSPAPAARPGTGVSPAGDEGRGPAPCDD